jgi:hypothetical protein
LRKQKKVRDEIGLVEKKLSSIRNAYLMGAISKKSYTLAVERLRSKIDRLKRRIKGRHRD